MKSKTLLYGNELLIVIDEFGETSFDRLQEKFRLKGDELRELLNYLKGKGYISWKMPLFVGSIERGINFIDSDKIKLDPKGMEVVLGQRDYFKDFDGTNVYNQTTIHNSQGVQIAQSAGNNNNITQKQEVTIEAIAEELEKELKKPKPDKSKIQGLIKGAIDMAKDTASQVISGVILKVLGGA